MDRHGRHAHSAVGLVQPRMGENGRGEIHVAFQSLKNFLRR
jgi:hypothetical protein